MRISDWSSDVCSSDLVEWLEAHFRAQVFPIVTPQALDPAHPFPFIPNRGSGVMFDLVRLSDSEPVRELDRKSVVKGKSVSGRVDIGGRRIINTKNKSTAIESAKTIY